MESINVDLDQKLVSIVTKPDQTLKDEEVTTIINDAGYDVAEIKRQK